MVALEESASFYEVVTNSGSPTASRKREKVLRSVPEPVVLNHLRSAAAQEDVLAYRILRAARNISSTIYDVPPYSDAGGRCRLVDGNRAVCPHCQFVVFDRQVAAGCIVDPDSAVKRKIEPAYDGVSTVVTAK